jgi:hypothetical protein|nr:MAG TPA: hypothetical protein [Bacteriophage sp.]
MVKAAIYLKNGLVCKTNNIEKKLKRESQTIEILEEWKFDSDLSKLDEKYNYWNRTLNRNTKEEEILESRLYRYINPKTKCTILSIYSDLEQCKSYIRDWNEYERIK